MQSSKPTLTTTPIIFSHFNHIFNVNDDICGIIVVPFSPTTSIAHVSASTNTTSKFVPTVTKQGFSNPNGKYIVKAENGLPPCKPFGIVLGSSTLHIAHTSASKETKSSPKKSVAQGSQLAVKVILKRLSSDISLSVTRAKYNINLIIQPIDEQIDMVDSSCFFDILSLSQDEFEHHCLECSRLW
ncbi:hypothetical protein V6N11_075632 [Hibiscus sabdariffa]|uniref:Uncharacterized protein n=2 Tax=Hibiscus sabdariffa TaxID=183260 RepID=A0ABR1ZNE3_9ROSI